MDIYVHKMNIYLHGIDYYMHAINIDVHNLNMCVHKMNIYVDSCRRNVGVAWPCGDGRWCKDAAPFQQPCQEPRVRKVVDDREPSPYIFFHRTPQWSYLCSLFAVPIILCLSVCRLVGWLVGRSLLIEFSAFISHNVRPSILEKA